MRFGLGGGLIASCGAGAVLLGSRHSPVFLGVVVAASGAAVTLITQYWRHRRQSVREQHRHQEEAWRHGRECVREQHRHQEEAWRHGRECVREQHRHQERMQRRLPVGYVLGSVGEPERVTGASASARGAP
jgi:predicted Holliday junction resolvase-like endonuclease